MLTPPPGRRAAIIGGVRTKYNVCVAEKDPARQRFLKSTYKLSTVDIAELIKRSDILILAVKPQNFEEILQEIKTHLQKRHLIISIAAGITTTYIEKRLGKGVRVIRTMPNLPAQIGKGTTAITEGKYATKKDLSICEQIFNCVGKTIRVAEGKIDAITAVSGSGPAYYFLFAEVFADAARNVGLSDAEAVFAVENTLISSSIMLEKQGEDAATLRKKVTSKGGTTEAALEQFFKGKFKETFVKAVKAAKARAKELSK